MGKSKLVGAVGDILPGTPGRKELIIYSTPNRVDTLTRTNLGSGLRWFDVTEYKVINDTGRVPVSRELVVTHRYEIDEDNLLYTPMDKIMREKRQ